MSAEHPVIAFGQQPCGIFPRRFLYAKICTALRLQREIGGEIIFFLHDSDHDPRETQTILRNRKTGEAVKLNFCFENKVQKKFSPLYLKRVSSEWLENTARQLPAFVDGSLARSFAEVDEGSAADVCLAMYRKMGLLNGIRVVRSSDPAFRQSACEVDDFFVDVPYEGEIVRARMKDGRLSLHEGGDKYIQLPEMEFDKTQISPARDTRFRWMQSVLHATHYIAGAGEQAYLDLGNIKDATIVPRDHIDRSDEAFVGESTAGVTIHG